MKIERINEMAAKLRHIGDEFDGPSLEQMEAALIEAVNEAMEEAAQRFESGSTTLKGDSATLAAGTLRGYKVKP